MINNGTIHMQLSKYRDSFDNQFLPAVYGGLSAVDSYNLESLVEVESDMTDGPLRERFK